MDKTEKAIELMKQKQYEEAANLFNQIIEEKPDDPLGYINFGNLLFHINDLEHAETFFRRAIAIDDTVPAAHYGLGNLYYEQEDFSKAQQYFQQAIELGLEIGDVYYMLGMSLVNQDFKALAIPYLQRATEIDKHDDKMFQYGLILAESNYLSEAKEVFEQVLEINTQHSDAYYNLGVLALYEEDAIKALDHFTAALSHQSDHVLAANGKARVEELLKTNNP